MNSHHLSYCDQCHQRCRYCACDGKHWRYILEHCYRYGNAGRTARSNLESKTILFNPKNQGILDRYRQIQPKFVFAETEVFYSGKPVDLLPKVAEVIRDLATQGLQRAILLPSRISGLDRLILDMSKWYAIPFFVL